MPEMTTTEADIRVKSAVPTFWLARPQGLWHAYLRVSGVKRLYETVRGKAFVQMPLKHQRYGDWEFEVRDLNGYVLVFGGGAEAVG